LPSVAKEHHWLEEGSATYIEPIARARTGMHTPEQVWRELVEGLPQGEPQGGDKGLDHTPTWGRTYWGGALYWMLCDIEIRKRTSNTKGLEDAFRGVIDAGGTIATQWEIERVLQTADKAVGVPVLEELYAAMANDPHPVDLDALWKELGVSLDGKKVVFDDKAPLAKIRLAITRKQ
jgi:predicted metalloprotease with PDZ domain